MTEIQRPTIYLRPTIELPTIGARVRSVRTSKRGAVRNIATVGGQLSYFIAWDNGTSHWTRVNGFRLI